MKNKKYTCPQCDSEDVVDIVYGYPSEQTLQSWFKKEIELGGCIIQDENPRHKCKKCEHQW
jgi:isocitrate lyase